MADILPFRKPGKPAKPAKPTDPRRGNTLCRSGFHKWALDKGTVFDVKRGGLVTVYRCERCGATKSETR